MPLKKNDTIARLIYFYYANSICNAVFKHKFAIYFNDSVEK